MRFNLLTTAVTALTFFSAPSFAAVTPAQIVTNIQILTSKSQALQAPAQSINIINGPLIVIGQGPFPQIISGFADIVSTATVAISSMQGSADVPAGPPAQAIADAFREFVRVHQVLLNILIGKAGLFTTIPLVGAPVAAVLRQVEGVVDTIAFALIDMVQSQATELTNQHNSLSLTLDTTIKSYSGIQLKRSVVFKA
ncbi:hypothetical protein B0J14DRAFT_626301 [Halenospora varia]|nr:hypothetical protein B0J14DRAFT_626301 [Halenospora varia]